MNSCGEAVKDMALVGVSLLKSSLESQVVKALPAFKATLVERVPPSGTDSGGAPPRFREMMPTLLQVGEELRHKAKPEVRLLVQVATKELPRLLQKLRELEVNFDVMSRDMHDDVSAYMKARVAANPIENNVYKCPKDADYFNDFRPLNCLTSFVDSLVKANPKIARQINIGTSVEGRPISVVEVNSKGFDNGAEGPRIIVLAGAHAREWLAISSGVYVLQQVIEAIKDPSTLSKNGLADYAALFKSHSFSVINMLNPDGYTFTWPNKHGDCNRMWRKNRNIVPGSSPCIGVDLNRNYRVPIFECRGSNPCSETFCGTSPLSEPETKGLADYVASKKTSALFVDLHTYKREFLVGRQSSTKEPSKEGREVAQAGAAKTLVPYQVDVSAQGPTGANFFTQSSVKYGYTLELRPENR